MSTIAARLLSKQSDFSQPKVIKVFTAGKVYRTAFPPDEILSLQFIGRSFTQRSSMTVLTSSLLKGDPNDFDANHYIFSVVDLSRGGLRRVLETDKELNDAADDAYRKGKVLRLEITGKITSRVLAESLLKSSFVSDIKNIVISGSATVGRAAMMSEGCSRGRIWKLTKRAANSPRAKRCRSPWPKPDRRVSRAARAQSPSRCRPWSTRDGSTGNAEVPGSPSGWKTPTSTPSRESTTRW